MSLKRKVMDRLIRWKHNPDKRCLLLQGARQVGKTFIVDQFAREQYEHYVDLNFEYEARYRDLFTGDNDVDGLVERIKLAVPGSVFVPGKTLLFLDEIQSCPAACTALKFLSLDGRLDVIASGSLLGINYAEVSSFPVGYVDRETMYSLDFEEFLWAMGVEPSTIAYVKGFFDRREQVPEAVNEQMMDYLRQYVAVGGMPRAVQAFADDHDYGRVLHIQRTLLDDYRDDIAKYAKDSEKAKARACFDSIPRQLARDSKRFTYGLVEKGSGARKYAGSLQWLYDAGIMTRASSTSAIA